MSVGYGFTIEIYGFTHSLHTFMARAAHDAITRDGCRGVGGQKSTPIRVQSAQQKDERGQDNGDRGRLQVSTRVMYFAR